MARALTLHETYTRQEVHDLFDPSSRFTPQAGTWGLWGIVPVPGKPGDFVFFVTYGKEQAGHKFDEWVSKDGIINWQSQPRQSLADWQIKQFINHDPTKNSIYLFLRTIKSGPYTYMGKLAYHAHDPRRERPVWIQWQILNWPIHQIVLETINLKLESARSLTPPPSLVGFDWRGKVYQIRLDDLREEIREVFRKGPPEEAIRFRDWYVEIDGQRVSSKWIFHLITGAGYNEFDAPTARRKLEKIGIHSLVVPISEPSPQPVMFSPSEHASRKVKEAPMARNYTTPTIRELKAFFLDLILLGEIKRDKLGKYRLNDSHKIEILESGLVYANPTSWVASPRLLKMLPMSDIDEFKSKLSIGQWDYGWSNFPERAFRLENNQKFPQLSLDYANEPKPDTLYLDTICRPVFLFEYLPREDWDDWSIAHFSKLHRVYTEPKIFLHSTLPIQNTYGGLNEFQDAVWKSAFYWLVLQLIILSDPQTGAVYDPKISLFLSNGWQDGSSTRLYFEDEYLGDLVDCLGDMLIRFNWIWVNCSGDPSQDQQAILGLLRLLLKLDIVELGKDGRVQFTEEYRRQLFESHTKAQLNYRTSREARDQLRETIKELKK